MATQTARKNINLIPDDHGVKGKAGRFTKIVKKIAMTWIFILIAGSIFGLSLSLFLSSQIRDNQAKEENLKNTLKTLETTEEKAFLIKDRVSKIKGILATLDGSPNAILIEKLSAALPSGLTVSAIAVDGSKGAITLTAQNSEVLTQLFDFLIKDETFHSVNLTDFNYAADFGYTVNLEVL